MARYGGRVSQTLEDAAEPPGPTYRPIGDIAEALGMTTPKVRQLLKDRALVGLRIERSVCIPAEFVTDGEIVKGLGGTITVLTDAGYTDREIIAWLFDDVSDARSAIVELLDGRSRYVHRRAQVAGF